MTRRSKIVFLNVSDPEEANWRKIVASGHSQFPVYEGTRSRAGDGVRQSALGQQCRRSAEPAAGSFDQTLFVPRSITVAQILDTFRKTGKHIALVTDEYGSVQGVVSLIDVMEAIVGDLPEPGDRREPEATQRENGSWLVDGGLDLADRKPVSALVCCRAKMMAISKRSADSCWIAFFGHIPAAGEYFTWNDWRFEVIDMDRHRVDKVLLTKLPLRRRNSRSDPVVMTTESE